MPNFLQEFFRGKPNLPTPDDLELVHYFDRTIDTDASTGYFMRAVSKGEIGAIKGEGRNINYRWFMLVDMRIPPIVLNMIIGRGFGNYHDYSHCLVLTPDVVARYSIQIDNPDSSTISRWYPAVQLSRYTSIPVNEVKDATRIVRKRLEDLGREPTKFELCRAVYQPACERDLHSCKGLR